MIKGWVTRVCPCPRMQSWLPAAALPAGGAESWELRPRAWRRSENTSCAPGRQHGGLGGSGGHELTEIRLQVTQEGQSPSAPRVLVTGRAKQLLCILLLVLAREGESKALKGRVRSCFVNCPGLQKEFFVWNMAQAALCLWGPLVVVVLLAEGLPPGPPAHCPQPRASEGALSWQSRLQAVTQSPGPGTGDRPFALRRF